MVAPIIAAKAGGAAKQALSGDIWSRTVMREVGKGKDKRQVESTVRINTGAILLGAGAVAVTVVGLGVFAFMMGIKTLPTTKAVTYGKWVWPDGADASKVILSTAAGTAPTRVVGEFTTWWLKTDSSSVFMPSYIPVEEGTPGAIAKVADTYETATWTDTETKDVLGFDLATRPTMAEGLTGAIDIISVPFKLASDPFAPVSDGIQAIKDKLRLP